MKLNKDSVHKASNFALKQTQFQWNVDEKLASLKQKWFNILLKDKNLLTTFVNSNLEFYDDHYNHCKNKGNQWVVIFIQNCKAFFKISEVFVSYQLS